MKETAREKWARKAKDITSTIEIYHEELRNIDSVWIPNALIESGTSVETKADYIKVLNYLRKALEPARIAIDKDDERFVLMFTGGIESYSWDRAEAITETFYLAGKRAIAERIRLVRKEIKELTGSVPRKLNPVSKSKLSSSARIDSVIFNPVFDNNGKLVAEGIDTPDTPEEPTTLRDWAKNQLKPHRDLMLIGLCNDDHTDLERVEGLLEGCLKWEADATIRSIYTDDAERQKIVLEEVGCYINDLLFGDKDNG